MVFIAYNFGHDEIDYATNYFKRWLWAKKPDMYWRMPISFGPFPGPRQDGFGVPQRGCGERTFATASVKFKTSRTFLETLLPTAVFQFQSPATVCMASVSLTTLGNMSWLGGGGYSFWGLYIHGVEYIKKDGSKVPGTFLPVMFEDLADPVISGRDELGMNKLYCAMDIAEKPGSFRLACSWRGAGFFDMALDGLKPDDPRSEPGTVGVEADFGILSYKYIPAVGEPGKADVEYAVVVPHEEEAKVVEPHVQAVARADSARLDFRPGDWHSLPTLHHVAARLAEMPIYEVVGAKVVKGRGVPDVSSARRIE